MAKKPRWESKYEKMLNEEPITEKITKLKEEIEKIKMNEVGTFTTKEEYDKALKEAKSKLPKKEEQLQDYENYEKNKDKIKNIYEYRKILEGKLAKLPKDRNKEIIGKNKELTENNAKIQEISSKVDELLAKINSGKLTDVEKSAEEVKLHNAFETERLLKEKSSDLENEISKLNIENSSANEKSVIAAREKYEYKIAKCNLIAANLLKGKELEDIQIRVEPANKVFKQSKPIEEQEATIEENKTNENYPINIDEFTIKHPKLAKFINSFKKGFYTVTNGVLKLFAKDTKTNNIQKNDEDMEEVKQVIGQALKEAKENKIEDELLKEIAEKGASTTFKDRLKVNKINAANNYAEKYGGQYEKQDGATLKKEKEIEL